MNGRHISKKHFKEKALYNTYMDIHYGYIVHFFLYDATYMDQMQIVMKVQYSHLLSK